MLHLRDEHGYMIINLLEQCILPPSVEEEDTFLPVSRFPPLCVKWGKRQKTLKSNFEYSLIKLSKERDLELAVVLVDSTTMASVYAHHASLLMRSVLISPAQFFLELIFACVYL